jgi:hypothetical protein
MTNFNVLFRGAALRLIMVLSIIWINPQNGLKLGNRQARCSGNFESQPVENGWDRTA